MRNIKYNYVCRNKGLYYRYIMAKRHKATWNGNTRGCLRIVRLERVMVRWIIPLITAFLLLSGYSAIASPSLSTLVKNDGRSLAPSRLLEKETQVCGVIKSVKVASVSDSTLLDINIAGRTLPVLAYSGREVTITLSNVLADKELAGHINTAGAVERISIEKTAEEAPGSTVRLDLTTPSTASLVNGPDSNTVRVKISPSATTAMLKVVDTSKSSDSPLKPKSYSFDAYDSDVVPLIKSLAVQSGLNIILIGNIAAKISAHFKNAPAVDALNMLTKSAGLVYYIENGTYYVGNSKDLSAAFPTQQIIYKDDQQVYQCRNISASDLAQSIAAVFDKNLLHVTLGAGEVSPRIDGASSGSGASSSGSSSSGSSSGSPSSGPSMTTTSGSASGGSSNTRVVIFSGEPSTVANAMALAERLDIRRSQIKIDVRITDISVDALKNLGMEWTFSNLTLREKTPKELGTAVMDSVLPGAMTHNPLTFDAAISALESSNKAKLLAAPSMSLLDGEKGSILIGQRVLYPVLIGYTQAQTPIFDKAEERVGIYLQLSVQMAGKDEIILSVYPQVSFITSYLNINGASYPQISTREQQTTVRVKNGQGIVIGGLISNQDLINLEKVPVLSSIPFFGELFKHRKTTHSQDEVVIMLKPVIQED